MTAATVKHSQALTAAAEALARVTIGNAGQLPVSELYSIAAELVDGCRNVSQTVAQLARHVNARSEAVAMRVDHYGASRYGTPDVAVLAAHGDLYGASVMLEVAVNRLTEALSSLATLAETGGRR